MPKSDAPPYRPPYPSGSPSPFRGRGGWGVRVYASKRIIQTTTMPTEPPKPHLSDTTNAASAPGARNLWAIRDTEDCLYLAYSSDHKEGLRAESDVVRLSPTLFLVNLVLPGMAFVFMPNMSAHHAPQTNAARLLIAFTVNIVFLAFVVGAVLAANRARYSRSGGRLYGRLFLRPDGIHDHSAEKITVLPWRNIKRIARTPCNLHFRRAGMGGVWITLSSFASPEQASRFVAAAMTLHQSGGNFAALPPDVCAEFADPHSPA